MPGRLEPLWVLPEMQSTCRLEGGLGHAGPRSFPVGALGAPPPTRAAEHSEAGKRVYKPNLFGEPPVETMLQNGIRLYPRKSVAFQEGN